MNRNRRTLERTILLEYKKGDLIFRQNDYGISIYRIVEGKVELFREHAGVKVPLGFFGRDDILGGTAFLRKGLDVRHASARAVEDSRLEVWHPRDLLKEYEKVSPILRYVADQAMNRIVRMNRFMERLAIERDKIKIKMGEERESRESRRYYRKKVSIPCEYAPAEKRGHHVTLKGRVRDLSMTGIGLEVDPQNDSLASHGIDDLFRLEFVLPNEKQLKVVGKIVHVTKKRDRMHIGMVFPELPDFIGETRKTLGFFLLRA